MRSFLLLVSMLSLPFSRVCSQAHVKFILKTSLAIDTAVIGHFTDKEFIRVPFKDTLELDFKIAKTDFYHVNYIQKEKIYNVKLFLDTVNITVYMIFENYKLLVKRVTGAPTFD